jgi:hypothetical protein
LLHTQLKLNNCKQKDAQELKIRFCENSHSQDSELLIEMGLTPTSVDQPKRAIYFELLELIKTMRTQGISGQSFTEIYNANVPSEVKYRLSMFKKFDL